MALPLAGLRILDLTQALAGPFATMILADLGADVVKVESSAGDVTRTSPPHYVDDVSVYFLANNRNKRGIVIDLKHPDGLAVFYELVGRVDVVVYNFAPGVADRLKIDHASLERVNPRIVTCDMTGFGRRGPEADRRAVDLIVQAMAGGMSITGEPGRPPVRAGVPTADLSTGLYAVIGILAACAAREKTGRGMRVATSLFHAQLSLLNYVAAYFLRSGDVPAPVGSGHPGTVPSQVFETVDGYVAVDAGFDKHFEALCDAIGRPELARDPKFDVRRQRNLHRGELIPMLAEAMRARPTREWLAELDARGIPCGPVNDVGAAVRSPQAAAYGAVREIPFGGETVEALATPLWFDDAPPPPATAPPTLGQHTADVLRDLLGYGPERVAALAAAGAIHVREPGSAATAPRERRPIAP